MMILDHVARAYGSFRPQSVDDFFALTLAKKLGDAAAAQHYALLASEYSQDSLVAAYHRAAGQKSERPLAVRFHEALKKVGRNGQDRGCNLLAIKVERRSIAAAVFLNDRLDYTLVRELSSAGERAQASAAGFINWLLANYPVETATLEYLSPQSKIRRAALARTVKEAVAEAALPVWEVEKAQLLQSYGHPPLRSRRQLRETVLSIWPVLKVGSGKDQVLDAAALGLYVQTERLFLK
jgi:hypothetical protein